MSGGILKGAATQNGRALEVGVLWLKIHAEEAKGNVFTDWRSLADCEHGLADAFKVLNEELGKQ